jgi:siroheme synthase-like protein
MDAFPAYFPLSGRKVVIAGAGDGADAKARLFEGSPAQIIRIDGPDALARSAYAGATLAFIAHSDLNFCVAAAKAAREAGVPVNVMDRPDLCDFTTPAVIDRGSVVAAIGTGGASPILASTLRSDIEARLPEGIGRVAALLQKLRDEIRHARPDMAERRDFLREALDGPAAQAALEGRMEDAEALLLASLGVAHGSRDGRVFLLDGRVPADLLTLRALRMLGEADGIAVGPGVDPALLNRARRDAYRLAADPAVMAEKTRTGARIVCLLAGGLTGMGDDLQALDVAVEVLPVGKA